MPDLHLVDHLFACIALFFIALSAAQYTVFRLLMIPIFRLSRLAAKSKKSWLFYAFFLPPAIAGLLTFGGVLIHQNHNSDLEHYFPFPPEQVIPVTAAWLINGAAWVLSAAGTLGILRLMRHTYSLHRDLLPHLRPPSPKLSAAIESVRNGGLASGLSFYEAEIPMAFSCLLGFRKIRCILSKDLVEQSSEAELTAVVAHEAIHLKSGDHRNAWIVSIISALFFFFPPVHWLARRWREAAEMACDAAAAALTREPLALASAILRAHGAPVRSGIRPVMALALADDAVCPTAMRVSQLITYAQQGVIPAKALESSTREWVVRGLIFVICIHAIFGTKALYAAHCSLEAIVRLFR